MNLEILKSHPNLAFEIFGLVLAIGLSIRHRLIENDRLLEIVSAYKDQRK